MKDGLHKILGYSVYVENGFVKYAVTGEGVHYRQLFIYKYVDSIGWLRTAAPTVSSFRHALKRGTIRLA